MQTQTTITPVNPNAQEEVKRVLQYLSSIEGKQVILGQHTQTMGQEELVYIYRVTGELPALCGFELLAYSPNINEKSDEECLSEVRAAAGTLKRAWDWAYKGDSLPLHGIGSLRSAAAISLFIPSAPIMTPTLP